MKKLYSFFILLGVGTGALAQQFNLGDLSELLSQPVVKFETHVARKDYKRNFNFSHAATVAYSYKSSKKNTEKVYRNISLISLDKSKRLIYQTSSFKESASLLEQIKKWGFISYAQNATEGKPVLYQWGSYSIEAGTELRDSIIFYSYLIEKKELPKYRDILFAEDLLQLSSHEYIAAVYGDLAVTKDTFYYSEAETNKCTVLFPKTNREVIFIWNDEENYRTPSFLIIGGHLRTAKTESFNRQVEQNLWQSAQGVYSGMSLKELQALNENPIHYYGWQMEQAGMLAPQNTGKIDFARLGVVLNCLNCTSSNKKRALIASSEKELSENKKIYVSTLIILPEKEKSATVAR